MGWVGAVRVVDKLRIYFAEQVWFNASMKSILVYKGYKQFHRALPSEKLEPQFKRMGF